VSQAVLLVVPLAAPLYVLPAVLPQPDVLPQPLACVSSPG